MSNDCCTACGECTPALIPCFKKEGAFLRWYVLCVGCIEIASVQPERIFPVVEQRLLREMSS